MSTTGTVAPREVVGKPSTARTAFFKSRYLDAPLVVDIEYIRHLTDAHRGSDGLEVIERRAHDHACALERMTPVIHEGDRIAGNKTRFIRGAIPYANYAAGPFLRELRRQEQDAQQKNIDQGHGGGIAEAHRAAKAQGYEVFSGKFLSSFAIKRTLQEVFPGRFTTIEPAAVEIHATYSGFADQVSAFHLAPDCDAKRQFLPDPATLAGRLLLADRGYPSVPYFEAVETAGGSFVVRLTRSYDPWVCAAWIDRRRVVARTRVRLSRFLAQRPGCHADLDVELVRGHRLGVRPTNTRTNS
jgi:hypothetical protein